MQKLKEYVIEMCEKYPHLRAEIVDHFHLCLDEIEDGESLASEIEHCYESIKELIEDNE